MFFADAMDGCTSKDDPDFEGTIMSCEEVSNML